MPNSATISDYPDYPDYPDYAVCVSCGTQFPSADAPPERCPVCEDDRQHVGWDGQRWTTMRRLAVDHSNRVEADGALLGIGVSPRFAIPQRALLVETDAGNILWDCVSLVTEDAVAALEERCGVDMIAISHPHFYSSMVEWSDALGGVPIHLHEADRQWVQRHSSNLSWWSGERCQLSATVSLLHLPGHFPGSSALYWTAGPNWRCLLLVGDSLLVADDRRHFSVMHSVPNHLPVGPSVIRDLRDRLNGVEFDDVYGWTWGLNVIGGADRKVAASLDRYLDAIESPR